MAPPGTIIGQIQATTGTPTSIAQVSATQLQQLQSANQQTLALSVAQQVPLPPTLASVKDDMSINGSAESAATSTQNDSSEDMLKETSHSKYYLFVNFHRTYIEIVYHNCVKDKVFLICVN